MLVEATFAGLPAGPVELHISRSSPGRYALHEFAKNVYGLTVVDGAGRALTAASLDPSAWTVGAFACQKLCVCTDFVVPPVGGFKKPAACE